MKKVFGMKNKKKNDDSDEESASYTDPAVIHAINPPSKNSTAISHPHYPPPRPCHGGNSPNPRRKNQETALVQACKKTQQNENNRNSLVGLIPGEPKRAPPRINITKKLSSDMEDDYCDPIDVQRKDDFIQEMKGKPLKDDYCEPWDTTIKTDMANKSAKKPSNSDDEQNEYLDPYDTGKEGIIEKRISRGMGPGFGVQHSKILTNEQRRSLNIDPKNQDASKPSSDDYDEPWEYKKRMQMGGKTRVPRPTSQDSHLLKTQVPAPGVKSRSPVPVPRKPHLPSSDGQLYEQPWDSMNQTNGQPAKAEGLYETPWDAANAANDRGSQSPRRMSQPAGGAISPRNNRKFSQPVIPSVPSTDNYDTPWEYKNKQQQFGKMGPPMPSVTPSAPSSGPPPAPSSDDYDMPWEYKNKQQFGMGPAKPERLHEIANSPDINPDIPLDQQSWYHGPLKRQEAEELLRDGLDCSFLVRNSESSRKDFSLSMKNNESFLHLKIVRQLDGQFILGQFSKPYMDIPKVINHYSRNKLHIRGAEHKYLKHPISAQPEYHTIEPEEDDVAL